MFATLAATIVGSILFVVIGNASGIIRATMILSIPMTQPNQNIGNFYVWATLALTAYVALMAYIWKPEFAAFRRTKGELA